MSNYILTDLQNKQQKIKKQNANQV